MRAIESSLRRGDELCFVGSSLGGFYATYFAETLGARAVLINPAIDPHIGLRAYLGPQKNLYTGEPYELTEAHLRQWERLVVPHITPSRYLLLVETGDEVLDYRQAVRALRRLRAGRGQRRRSQPEELSGASCAHLGVRRACSFSMRKTAS